MRKIIGMVLLCQLICSTVFVAAAYAEDKAWTGQYAGEFAEIKTRLESIDKQQQELLAKDQEILERLDQLRIWVHRR